MADREKATAIICFHFFPHPCPLRAAIQHDASGCCRRHARLWATPAAVVVAAISFSLILPDVVPGMAGQCDSHESVGEARDGPSPFLSLPHRSVQHKSLFFVHDISDILYRRLAGTAVCRSNQSF